MKTLTIPEGYQSVMPYLIVENAVGFLNFAKEVFGAEEKYKAMRDENTIQHAELTIGGSVIMFTDATPQYGGRPAGFFIYVADCDEAYEKSLTNGATSIAAPADQAYGRSAGIEDAFGNTWWITSVNAA
jgi:PhnB protein